MVLVRNSKNNEVLELVGVWEYSRNATRALTKIEGPHEFEDMEFMRYLKTRPDEVVMRLQEPWRIYRK
jgi:hypothetical protein